VCSRVQRLMLLICCFARRASSDQFDASAGGCFGLL
jgi:hypothetical protein